MALENAAPDMQWVRLRKYIPKRVQPYLRGLRKRVKRFSLSLESPFHEVYPYTQQHIVKQRNLVRLGNELDANGIKGAIVECGVLDGGSAALMAYATSSSGREVHLFDAWQGLPDPTDKDGIESKKWAGEAVGSPVRVSAIMKRLGISQDRLHFHKGWFHETFPKESVGKVALLHVDCDFYDPVLLTLNHWFPKMAGGGYIQIDDYGAFQGCDQAVHEFLKVHPELKLESVGTGSKASFIRCPT